MTIRDLAKEGEKIATLARRFGLSRQTTSTPAKWAAGRWFLAVRRLLVIAASAGSERSAGPTTRRAEGRLRD